MAIRFQYQVPAGMVGAYAAGQANRRSTNRKYAIDARLQQQRHAQRMAELEARRGALGRRAAAGGGGALGGRVINPVADPRLVAKHKAGGAPDVPPDEDESTEPKSGAPGGLFSVAPASRRYKYRRKPTPIDVLSDFSSAQLEARPKTRSVEAAPIDRKTEAGYGRAFEKALAAGGVPQTEAAYRRAFEKALAAGGFPQTEAGYGRAFEKALAAGGVPLAGAAGPRPLDRKTEAAYRRAFEKALAAGGVPQSAFSAGAADTPPGPRPIDRKTEAGVPLAGAADTPAGPRPIDRKTEAGVPLAGAADTPAADTPPGPRPWPRSVTAAPIGDPPSEDAFRDGMSKKGGTYYAIPKPIKPKKPLPEDPLAWTEAHYKRSKEEKAARDSAAKKWNAPDAVRNRAKWAAKKAAKKARRGASAPAAAAPAGTPGTATPSVSPGTPGVTMLSDGGAIVDPLATHPDFAATGAPFTPEQKNAQIRLRVQQKAQIKDAQRKYRLGKTPTATDLLPRHVSPEEVARQQEFAETTRVEGLERAKEDRAREDRDRTLAAATAKGRRSYASSEIAGLEMPEWASRDDQLELRGKLRTLREFKKLDNDWNSPDLLKNYNDAIKDYRNTLAAMREKESKKYEIPFTERLRDYLEAKFGPGGYEKWKHLPWEATDDPDVFEVAKLKEKEEPKEAYDKADLVRRFRKFFGKDDGEGGTVTAPKALELAIKEQMAEMEVLATLPPSKSSGDTGSAPPDPAAEAPLELKPSGIESPSVEAPAAGDPVAPPSAAPEADAGAAATPESGMEDTTSAEAPAVVPELTGGSEPSAAVPVPGGASPVPTTQDDFAKVWNQSLEIFGDRFYRTQTMDTMSDENKNTILKRFLELASGSKSGREVLTTQEAEAWTQAIEELGGFKGFIGSWDKRPNEEKFAILKRFLELASALPPEVETRRGIFDDDGRLVTRPYPAGHRKSSQMPRPETAASAEAPAVVPAEPHGDVPSDTGFWPTRQSMERFLELTGGSEPSENYDESVGGVQTGQSTQRPARKRPRTQPTPAATSDPFGIPSNKGFMRSDPLSGWTKSKAARATIQELRRAFPDGPDTMPKYERRRLDEAIDLLRMK